MFDCRNKFVQLLQIEMKSSITNKEKMEKKIVEFVIDQRVKHEADVDWKQWPFRQ